MGYKLRQWGKTRKNNKTAMLLILLGFVVNAILSYINYIRGLKGLPVDVIQYYKNPFSYAPLAPIEVVASCLIFAGFSVMDIKRDFARLAGYTFLIYLIHAGVWDVLSAFIEDNLVENQVIETTLAVCISLFVFVASLLVSVIYNKIQLKFIENTTR